MEILDYVKRFKDEAAAMKLTQQQNKDNIIGKMQPVVEHYPKISVHVSCDLDSTVFQVLNSGKSIITVYLKGNSVEIEKKSVGINGAVMLIGKAIAECV